MSEYQKTGLGYLEFEKLADRIKKLSGGKRVLYVPNEGNFGDAFIRSATKKFFRHFNIRFKEARVKTEIGWPRRHFSFPPLSDSLLVYGGGGAWCKKIFRGFAEG